MITLIELCGADTAVRFSPFAWRVRLILDFKGIDYQTNTMTFSDKSALEGSGYATAPTIRDGDTWVNDSFKIARYLEDKFPEKPIFGTGSAPRQALLLNNWFDRNVVMNLFPLIAKDIVAALNEESAALFQPVREARFGKTFAEMVEGREEARAGFLQGMAPVEALLADAPFMGGEAPDFADLCLMGTLMWPYSISSFDPIEGSDVLTAWRERMFDTLPGNLKGIARAT